MNTNHNNTNVALETLDEYAKNRNRPQNAMQFFLEKRANFTENEKTACTEIACTLGNKKP